MASQIASHVQGSIDFCVIILSPFHHIFNLTRHSKLMISSFARWFIENIYRFDKFLSTQILIKSAGCAFDRFIFCSEIVSLTESELCPPGDKLAIEVTDAPWQCFGCFQLNLYVWYSFYVRFKRHMCISITFEYMSTIQYIYQRVHYLGINDWY